MRCPHAAPRPLQPTENSLTCDSTAMAALRETADCVKREAIQLHEIAKDLRSLPPDGPLEHHPPAAASTAEPATSAQPANMATRVSEHPTSQQPHPKLVGAQSSAATGPAPDKLSEWISSLPLPYSQEALGMPPSLDLHSKAKRGRVNLGITNTTFKLSSSNSPEWSCKVNMHLLPSTRDGGAAQGNSIAVIVPSRAPENRVQVRVQRDSLFIMLLELDWMRVQRNDMPRDAAPVRGTGQLPVLPSAASQHSKPELTHIPLASADEEASSSWVTYSSWMLWDAFLCYTRRTVMPEGGKPRSDVRRELAWHGPSPDMMQEAARAMGVVCKFDNWCDVYATAVGRRTPGGGSGSVGGTKRAAEGVAGVAPLAKRAAEGVAGVAGVAPLAKRASAGNTADAGTAPGDSGIPPPASGWASVTAEASQ